MAIKDIIVPGFVGTSTIKWIVTRGFSIGAVVVTPVVTVTGNVHMVQETAWDVNMAQEAIGNVHVGQTIERDVYG